MTLPDPRNEHIQIYVGDRLYPREEAKVSVFDSSVQGGDAVWEGLRVYDGRIFQLEAHLSRMRDSAKAMAFKDVPSKETIKQAIFQTLQANGMRNEAHIRLTLTRGKKVTSGMSPAWNQYGPCLIVLAEWKKPVYDNTGIRLITSSIRRNPPQCVDSKIHHNNLINNILAKIEANLAGVDDAVMLDIQGYVSETNATNIFLVKKGKLLTPFADSCLPGITRSVVMRIAEEKALPFAEKNLSITEMYTADELFVTGTMGEITPVLEVDGRVIGEGLPGSLTRQVQEWYATLTQHEGDPLP
jgi:branched-chain amino acid aminotransferase group I